MTRTFIAIIAAAILAGPAYAAAAADDPPVDAGRKIFAAQKCNMCHQAEGKGNKMYPLDGVSEKLTEADLRKWITAPAEMEAKLKSPPKMKMSSRKFTLKPDEVDALVAYLKSLK